MRFRERNQLGVRPARRRDAGAIAAIHVRAWQAAYSGIIPADFLADMSVQEVELSWDQVVTNKDVGHEVLVATSKRTLIGWISFGICRDEDAKPHTAELHGLYIDPEWWRCGAASALVRRALERLQNQGYSDVSLWVLEANRRARSFYEWWGFEPDGRTSAFARSGWSRPKLRMRRSLVADA